MRGNFTDDARVASRGLVLRPFYAVASIVMLALAIGANATAFGIFYGFLFRPLPYQAADHLFLVNEHAPRTPINNDQVSPSAYRVIRNNVPALAESGLYLEGGVAPATIAGHPTPVTFDRITPSFLRTLGVRPEIGRLPSLAAGRRGGPPEAMISYKFWQKSYGGSAGALQRQIAFNGHAYQIVGVLPRGYAFNQGNDVQLPMVFPLAGLAEQNPQASMVVRLPKSAPIAGIDNALQRAVPDVVARLSPLFRNPLHDVGLSIVPLRPALEREARIGVLPDVLQGTALLLLVLAIANTANLALVRNRARLHEFALRRVLGGSRSLMLRLLLLEQIPIALIVFTLGSVIGWIGSRFILSYGAAIVVAPFHFGFGWNEITLAAVLTVVTLVLTGIAPAIMIMRYPLQVALSGGPKATIGRASRRVQRSLGIIQIALACALLAGSLTLSIGQFAFLNRKLGFSPNHRIIAQIITPETTTLGPAMRDTITRLRGESYVRDATAAGFITVPFSSSRAGLAIMRDQANATGGQVNAAIIGDHYTSTLGITIQAGRGISRLEQTNGAKVTVIGAGVARRLFGTTDPIGQIVTVEPLGKFSIIGVAAPVVWRIEPWHRQLGTIYLPLADLDIPGYPLDVGGIILNIRGSIASAEQDAKSLIETMIPGSVVASIHPYTTMIDNRLALRRMAAAIVAIFAALALSLAALGVYAVNAFIARARLPEFGMRAMLGASPSRLLRLALTDAAWLLAFGLTGGIIGGYLLVRAMSPLLFHEAEIAPFVFAATLAIIAGLVLIAAWRPAARAANLPVKTLLDAA
ncbi:ABC transporter permease [Acidiphilium sp. PA]|uniref:ABC transporter permease n=1 Tax=Acidiphilium sp. PA TaxID=2871705 RepID=UPI002243DEAB|nr:ABC transporter permease [Acidiphilium sp. PA]MCW8307598.1 ABC transporter permease [Acidiphilium sp. PA]